MINFRTSANLVRVLALAAFLLATIQTASAADDRKDCDLFNFTDRVVTQVYMCAADVDINEYGTNILEGLPPLQNGASIPIQYPAQYRYYNLKVVFDNGEFVDWENVDCNNMSKITLYKNGSDYRAQVN